MARPWLVLREGERRRWGGDLRRRYLLDGLIERTGATALDGWPGPATLARALRGPRWQPWRRRALVASTEFLMADRLEVAAALGEPVLVDVHDDPIRQAEALGIAFEPAVEATIRRRIDDNIAAFPMLSAPSPAFARLAGLPLARVLVASNGTDPNVIRTEPWPASPAIGFVSGAAPNRGIESLIEAVRLIRRRVPEVRLLLWLAATGEASETYLRDLTTGRAAEPWIEIGGAPYDRFSRELGRVTTLCIPTPDHPYWDSVAPIKLFDGLASGRPVVVTPRTDTSEIVRRHDAGIVAEADDPEALAAALLVVVNDDLLARRLGANARRAAETTYDWRIIGLRLADELLARLA